MPTPVNQRDAGPNSKPPALPYLYTLLVEPRLFLLGCVIGFLFCMIQGYAIANHGYIKDFKHFTPFTDPERYYYPPIRQLRALAREKIDDVKKPVLVIIGGSSVLNGVGQPLDKLWSIRLQQLLGDKFAVVNLSMRGTPSTAGGECVAENLIKTGVPVIYVGDVGHFGVPADGGDVCRYQYWQARTAGFLYPNPVRLISARHDDVNGEELRCDLGEVFRFDDMWSHFSYHYFASLWMPPMEYGWWQPRRTGVNFDGEKGPLDPVPHRFERNNDVPFQVGVVRDMSRYDFEKDAQGNWKEKKGDWDQHDIEFRAALVPEVRDRTVLIRQQSAPYFWSQLTPDEKLRDYMEEQSVIAHATALGFTPVTYRGFVDDDFLDRCHLTASGGRKLADLVAPAVLSLAHKLYGTEGKIQPLQD